MRLDRVRLQNFKCFADLEVNLDPKVNIVVGINGSGKTALLEGLSVALGGFFLGMHEVKKRNIKGEEIRVGIINDEPEYQTPASIEAKSFIFENEVTWERELLGIKNNTTTSKAKEISEISLAAYKKVQTGEQVNLPILAYFSSRRLFPDTKSKDSSDAIGRLKGYNNSLNGFLDKIELANWIKVSEFEKYQKRKHINPEFEDWGMKLIQKVVKDFIPNVNSFYYSLKFEGIVFLDENGVGRLVRTLNDGYRNIFGLLLDLVYRCTQLNPHLGEKALEETEGVVLIDELDLHLYPKLQREILPLLLKTFPKIQWVITTHSPIVISSTKAKLIVLDNYAVKEEDSYYGKNIEYVLKVLMDVPVRQNEVQRLLNEYRAFIEKGQSRSKEAEELRLKIENLIGNDDPEYLAIRDLIFFFE